MKLCALLLPIALVAVAACDKKPDAACAARVATLTTNLATPRAIAEIRKGAGPELAADLDAVEAAGDSGRAVALAGMLQRAVAGCPQASRVFGQVASIETDKEAFIRAKFPAALADCSCKASPEHAGGLVEAMLASWDKPRAAATP